jgi:anti-anti-sigma regulatory factor
MIRLEGVIDIASAAELKAVLVDALKPGKRVRMALDANADLDVTSIQLLWAAKRETRASGVEFALEGPAPEPVIAAIRDAGFEAFPVPE